MRGWVAMVRKKVDKNCQYPNSDDEISRCEQWPYQHVNQYGHIPSSILGSNIREGRQVPGSKLLW